MWANPGCFVAQRFGALELARTWQANLAAQLAEGKASTKPVMFPLSTSLIAVTMQCCDLSIMIAGCGKSMVNILKVGALPGSRKIEFLIMIMNSNLAVR